MKRFAAIACTLALTRHIHVSNSPRADKATLDGRLANARDVINEVMATPDKGIPQTILAGASCVVVIPSYKKGAFIVGRTVWPGRGYLPHPPRLERSGLRSARRWQLRLPDRRPVN